MRMTRCLVPAFAMLTSVSAGLALLTSANAAEPAPEGQGAKPVAPSTQPAGQPAARPGGQTPQVFEMKQQLKYLLYLPQDYEKDAGKAWPLVLFLHGSGERGTDLEVVKKHGPPKLVAGGKQFPFILASPQCPPGSWWDPTVLKGLVDDVQAHYHVDPDRVYCTGLSMGGFGTWELARRYPQKFAAIAPICGGGDPQFAKSLAHMPAWVFHGEEDHTVPIQRSEEMVEALKKAGDTEVKFTRYPGVGHDSWVKAYDDPELFEWMLSHKREHAATGDARTESNVRPNAEASVPSFHVQEIDKSLKVGYGVKLVDLNGDGRPDIVVADSERVIWFENPGKSAGRDTPWKLHTILDDKQAGLKIDNVCIDAYDIDGDGKIDLVLGADWQPGNTNGGGSLQWLRQGANIDEPWTVHTILSELPTLHRAHFGNLDGGARPQLIVGPLKGAGSTPQKNFTDVGARLLAFDIPGDPVKDKWEPRVLTDQLHVLHNFLAVPPMDSAGNTVAGGSKAMQVLTASYEGVNLLTPAGGSGRWTVTQLGAGNQEKPNGSRGSSEVKIGHLKTAKGSGTFLATVEPFHGNQVVVYTPSAEAVGAGKADKADKADTAGLWPRKVLDDRLHEGHAVWCADLDGDGSDEIIVGWRAGAGTGIRIYKAKPGTAAGDGAPEWSTHDLDVGGVAVEDLAAADLDGDGRIDIVAVGRATHNVRIYWNEGQE